MRLRSILPVVLSAIVGAVMLSIPLEGRILDLRFWYTGAEALQYLESLSVDAGRQYWLHELLDLVFMSSYSWAFFVFWPVSGRLANWRALSLLPGALDFIETFGILLLLSACSVLPRAPIATAVSSVTPIKYLAFYGVLIFELVGRLILRLFIEERGSDQTKT